MKDSNGEIVLHTRRPLWNSEINTYVHNFGCRVKKASNRNFIVVRSVSHTDEATDVMNGVRDTATFDSANSICIRHGKVKYYFKTILFNFMSLIRHRHS